MKLLNIFSLLKNATKFFIKMENQASVTQAYIAPPATVKCMKSLDRNAFTCSFKIPALYIHNEKLGTLNQGRKGKINPKIKSVLFKYQKLRTIRDLPADNERSGSHKVVLLNIDCVHDNELSSLAKDTLLDLLDANEMQLHQEHVDFTYDTWMYYDIFKAVLPDDSQGIGGYASTGHILHLNIKKELEEYKFLIGEVLLDKVPSARTVVNKLNEIDNTYRNFKIEVLAGEEDFVTTARENGVSYKMDFSKVYWNSKLGTEHQRVVSLLKKGDIVFDVFAGIGPFAIPAVKSGCTVFANDLNPESVSWMKENVTINKVKNVQVFNLDGREFITTVLKTHLLSYLKSEESGNVHVVMNLPAIAIEFLDAFIGLLADVDRSELLHRCMPTVHCYCFSKAANLQEDVKQRIEGTLGCEMPSDFVITNVRNVAPNKEMMRATFKLSENLLFDSREESVSSQPPSKKVKTVEIT